MVDKIVKEVDLPRGIFETLIINNDLSIKIVIIIFIR